MWLSIYSTYAKSCQISKSDLIHNLIQSFTLEYDIVWIRNRDIATLISAHVNLQEYERPYPCWKSKWAQKQNNVDDQNIFSDNLRGRQSFCCLLWEFLGRFEITSGEHTLHCQCIQTDKYYHKMHLMTPFSSQLQMIHRGISGPLKMLITWARPHIVPSLNVLFTRKGIAHSSKELIFNKLQHCASWDYVKYCVKKSTSPPACCDSCD